MDDQPQGWLFDRLNEIRYLQEVDLIPSDEALEFRKIVFEAHIKITLSNSNPPSQTNSINLKSNSHGSFPSPNLYLSSNTMNDYKLEIFISYAHEDENYRKELLKHLKLMERQGQIKTWHDRVITAGSEWKNVIDSHLETAHIILLLISSDFLASDYCYDIEMERALTRHDQGKATVIPIILRSADWHNSPFAKLQALPKDAKAISSWDDPDQAYTSVVQGIRKVIEGDKEKFITLDPSQSKVKASQNTKPNPQQYQENKDKSTGYQIDVSGGTVNINPPPSDH